MRVPQLVLLSLLLGSSQAIGQTPNPLAQPANTSPTAEVVEVQEVVAASSTEILADKYWFTRSGMMAWSKGQKLPPYLRVPVATGPEAATEMLKPDGIMLQGIVGEAGMWLSPDRRLGAELGGVVVFQGGRRVGPDPFYSPKDNTAALFTTEARTRFFTVESSLRKHLYSDSDTRVDLLLGYRFGYLGEDATASIEIPSGFGLMRFNDRADTKNYFHGGQVGVSFRYAINGWTLDATTKLAMGGVMTDAELIGSSRALLEFGPDRNSNLAKIAQLTKRETTFALMPTVSIRLSQKLTEHGRMFVGYEFLYISNVGRPENVLNIINAPRSNDWSRKTTDYWLQGGTVGMEWRY